MSKVNIEELKRLIDETKSRSPNRPLYPDSVKEGIGQLAQHLSRSHLKNELGVSESYIERAKKIVAEKSKLNNSIQRKKTNQKKISNSTQSLQFLELPSSLVNKNLTVSNPSMKVTLANGISIEIWG